MSMIAMSIPPFPTFIRGGDYTFHKGERHFSRVFTVFDLLYVKKGTLFMQEGKKRYDVREGQYVILVPGERHEGYADCVEQTDYYWLHFVIPGNVYQMVEDKELDWSFVYKKEPTFTEAGHYQFHLPQFGEVNRREIVEQQLETLLSIRDGNTHVPEDYLRQQIQFSEFVIQLQKEAFSIPSATEKVCESAMKYIQENYKKQVNMSVLKEELNYHPDYLTRCMQKTIGISPIQYLTHYRLNQAKRLLAETEFKVSAISREVGIEDVTYFSKLFKKLEGTTPMEYRRLVHRK
ncbi:AraC family transcriptional regulator [Sutcliffiella horikoshii]|uniref:helix-turn-helix transcriptional regulator n=1 Tax=Sutcliffiella horikoshii TaxID=79883 RepID=UPI00203CF6EC|nr:helix-turn-helix domain-containing protein [Sutcliffiella horikoshii]MCM3616904.1 AraC family transcriptional regulator [Sutcliffiella horikoshii]